MARRRKREAVTVTFHYLMRTKDSDTGEPIKLPIALADYREAMERLVAAPPLDTSTQQAVDALRFGTTVPIQDVVEIESNLYFGTYKGVYTGHSYENTAKGIIPHDSASLRKFYFLAYRSVSGRVYISTQYLGQFGSYTGLKNTILRAFSSRKGLEAYSIRNESSHFANVEAKEIIIEYMRSSEKIGEANPFKRGATVVLKKSGGGEEFAEATRKRLFSLLDGPIPKIKSEVARILREDQLILVKDEDILNCTVIASVDGRDRRYHFINDSNFASPYHLSVGMTSEGHPDADQVKIAMRNLLKSAIISKAEHV